MKQLITIIIYVCFTVNAFSQVKTNKMKIAANTTEEVIKQFNESFRIHDISILNNLIAENCVMESTAKDSRTVGKIDCIDFWQQLIEAKDTQFTTESVTVMGEKAIILWRYQWAPEEENSVRGVNIMTVKNGLITEALGYVKILPTK
ncbi:nuclear transport factor 2 family protein [Flavobacterium psychrophilum]|nr:nuclear transport factor 2 family protein [Flavobacterium psychrophilum]EKT4510838.1 nuclear transport factor 2 family protein [Flavobacterium psychrophilum]